MMSASTKKYSRATLWLRMPGIMVALLLGTALTTTFAGCATTGDDNGPLFYPAPPQRPRIQYLKSIARAEDVEGGSNPLVTFLVGNVKGNRALRKPTGVAAHGDRIYVADPGWDTVIVIDLAERTFDTIRDRGAGKLRMPVAIAIDATGNKFIADTGRHQIVQFNERDEFVRAFGNPNELWPSGVAVDERLLYVVNRTQSRVEIYDRYSKEQVDTFGEFGQGDGQFNIPTSIVRDESGHLYVTDAANFRVQEFDAEYNFVQSYGFLGDGPGTFARPRGMAIDREGHLYVADAAFENVQIWDNTNAQVLMAFGGPGVGPGSMYLPASVHVNYDLNDHFRDLVDPEFELDYVVLVANNYGPNKLAIYGFVVPKDPSAYPEIPLPED